MDRLAEIEAELRFPKDSETLIRLLREKTRLELQRAATPDTARDRQARLAGAVRLTQNQISRAERGVRALTVSELLRIAIQLERAVGYFLEPPDPDEVVRTGWERGVD